MSDKLITDCGKNIVNGELNRVCRIYDIKQRVVSAMGHRDNEEYKKL